MPKCKMLIPLEKNIEVLAGDAVCRKIMEGSEAITEKTDKKTLALWVQRAMEKMDALVDEKTRLQIMENCRYNCATVNKKVIARAPEGTTVSSTYCNCAKGFVKTYWESVLGKPVQVQLK